MAREWSVFEGESIFDDYFAMLRKELRGEPYSKTEHRRTLARLLDGRSDGSIEYKHENISAVLIELGYPYIEGYKPRRNFQRLLYEAVAAKVSIDHRLEQAVRVAVDAPAEPVARGKIRPHPRSCGEGLRLCRFARELDPLRHEPDGHPERLVRDDCAGDHL
jgi:hypothetical protein